MERGFDRPSIVEEPEDRVVFFARMLPDRWLCSWPLVNTNYDNYDNCGACVPKPMIRAPLFKSTLNHRYLLYQSRDLINILGYIGTSSFQRVRFYSLVSYRISCWFNNSHYSVNAKCQNRNYVSKLYFAKTIVRCIVDIFASRYFVFSPFHLFFYLLNKKSSWTKQWRILERVMCRYHQLLIRRLEINSCWNIRV